MGFMDGLAQGYGQGSQLGVSMLKDMRDEDMRKQALAQADAEKKDALARQLANDAESKRRWDAEMALKSKELSKKDEGKPLPSTGVNMQDLANFPTDLANLKKLGPNISAHHDVVGPWAGRANAALSYLPGFLQPQSAVDYKELQSSIGNVKQTIGKLKEGGVLRAEDEKKYENILASLNERPETAIYKINQIADEMASKYNDTIKLLGKQGYKTAGLEYQQGGTGGGKLSRTILNDPEATPDEKAWAMQNPDK